MIYLHIPFCKSFCLYCDFYSEICNGFEAKYPEAVLREIDEREKEIAGNVSASALAGADTLYIGGGTPSVLPLEGLRAIVERLGEIRGGRPYDEFTVEVNPEDIVEKGLEYVRGLKALGASRISMGVQSFDDRMLRWMNRRHDAARAEQAFNLLREGGFDNISIDLIFGISHLSDEIWASTIEKAVELGPEHISAYQLSIEEGSGLARLVERGKYTEAPEEDCARQYSILCEKLAAAEFNHYEISNFAKPDFEARHNSAYWTRIPYVGLGPGAHSFSVGDEQVRSWNPDNLKDYIDGKAVREKEVLTSEDLEVETVMLALRTAKGSDNLAAHCSAEKLQEAISRGDIITTPSGNLRIPESRFFISDSIISNLI
jgi:oxygen-independent coproporphyrinogen-3 oxidase